MRTVVSSLGQQTAEPTSRERQFDWPVCSEAEEFLGGRLGAFLSRNTFARTLAQRMRDETGTLFLDWVDHVTLAKKDESALRDVGFVEARLAMSPDHCLAFHHPAALLPRVILAGNDFDFPAAVAIKVERLVDFMMAHGLSHEPEGEPLSQFRRLSVSRENETEFQAIERRGYRGLIINGPQLCEAKDLLKARELWQTRSRGPTETEGYRVAFELLERMIKKVGRDLACHVVFEAERHFWQRKNRAAQMQKERQDRLGLGWANHDHHTFRSSREHFLDLMQVMDKLGFERRERYYAGAQAGWGAQILEQPVEGIVVFADLDLLPEETEYDFSRRPLTPASRLGTVGLWVALHGESFLEAGMHHLEARFDFTLVRQQLKEGGITGMAPFSDFDFLKQAFTEGERWPVRAERAETLRRTGLITSEQYERFVADGAIGSHLETLQRRGGFKGFNQKSVSAIIAATDPRKQHAASA